MKNLLFRWGLFFAVVVVMAALVGCGNKSGVVSADSPEALFAKFQSDLVNDKYPANKFSEMYVFEYRKKFEEGIRSDPRGKFFDEKKMNALYEETQNSKEMAEGVGVLKMVWYDATLLRKEEKAPDMVVCYYKHGSTEGKIEYKKIDNVWVINNI